MRLPNQSVPVMRSAGSSPARTGIGMSQSVPCQLCMAACNQLGGIAKTLCILACNATVC